MGRGQELARRWPVVADAGFDEDSPTAPLGLARRCSPRGPSDSGLGLEPELGSFGAIGRVLEAF